MGLARKANPGTWWGTRQLEGGALVSGQPIPPSEQMQLPRLRGSQGLVHRERTGVTPFPRFSWLQEGKCGLPLPRGALGVKRGVVTSAFPARGWSRRCLQTS